jgi:hypothetical protein
MENKKASLPDFPTPLLPITRKRPSLDVGEFG